MNHKPLPPDDSWESDAVWKLLDQAAPKTAGSRFADDTVRAARLAGQGHAAWWRRILGPLPLGGLAAAAALVIAFVSLPRTDPTPPVAPVAKITSDEPFAEMQELVETEALNVAVDHLDEFTDTELIFLIGL